MYIELSNEDKKSLEPILIPKSTRLKITKLIKGWVATEDQDLLTVRKARFINRANNVLNNKIFVLEPDEMGNYDIPTISWVDCEFEVMIRRPSTVQLVEILIDFFMDDLIGLEEINRIFLNDSIGIEIQYIEKIGSVNHYEGSISIHYLTVIEKPTGSDKLQEDKSIATLLNRMEKSFETKDYSAVLHASASCFEAQAKKIIDKETALNQTLGSLIEQYRSRSYLPEEFIEYILSIYRRRNSEPNAGHGSPLPSTVTEEDAIFIRRMTYALLEIENDLEWVNGNR